MAHCKPSRKKSSRASKARHASGLGAPWVTLAMTRAVSSARSSNEAQGAGAAWYARNEEMTEADALSTPLSDGWSALQSLLRWQAVAHLRSDNRQHFFGLHRFQQALEFLV